MLYWGRADGFTNLGTRRSLVGGPRPQPVRMEPDLGHRNLEVGKGHERRLPFAETAGQCFQHIHGLLVHIPNTYHTILQGNSTLLQKPNKTKRRVTSAAASHATPSWDPTLRTRKQPCNRSKTSSPPEATNSEFLEKSAEYTLQRTAPLYGAR